jgi:hypothetical protein
MELYGEGQTWYILNTVIVSLRGTIVPQRRDRNISVYPLS